MFLRHHNHYNLTDDFIQTREDLVANLTNEDQRYILVFFRNIFTIYLLSYNHNIHRRKKN